MMIQATEAAASDDNWRQFRHEYGHIHMNPDEREYRYEERDGDFSLKRWQDGAETVTRGDIDARPEWLRRIITAAIVGGHLKRINQPPPDAIVWFTTDLDNNLITFLELT